MEIFFRFYLYRYNIPCFLYQEIRFIRGFFARVIVRRVFRCRHQLLQHVLLRHCTLELGENTVSFEDGIDIKLTHCAHKSRVQHKELEGGKINIGFYVYRSCLLIISKKKCNFNTFFLTNKCITFNIFLCNRILHNECTMRFTANGLCTTVRKAVRQSGRILYSPAVVRHIRSVSFDSVQVSTLPYAFAYSINLELNSRFAMFFASYHFNGASSTGQW